MVGLTQSQPWGYMVGVQFSARIRKPMYDFKGQFKQLSNVSSSLPSREMSEMAVVLLAACLRMRALPAHCLPVG